MTAIPPPEPLDADTDEAVSALLDGELDAFAADHGTTEAEVRARLEAWAGFDTRRVELAQARATVATPTAALDDLTRRRLVRTASNARPAAVEPARRARLWSAIGVAAAAIVLVVGIGLAIDAAGNDGSRSSDSASSAGSVAPGLHGDIGNVGDLERAERAACAARRDARRQGPGARGQHEWRRWRDERPVGRCPGRER